MSSSWPQMVNSSLQLLGELFQREQITQIRAVVSSTMPHCFSRANGMELGPGANANRETRPPKSCLIIQAMPASFKIFPLLVNINPDLLMLQPHQGMATQEWCQMQAKIWEMLLVSPSSWKTLSLKAVPGTAGTALAWQHQGIYSLWHDCIRSSMTANKTELHPTALKSSNSELLHRLDLFK